MAPYQVSSRLARTVRDIGGQRIYAPIRQNTGGEYDFPRTPSQPGQIDILVRFTPAL